MTGLAGQWGMRGKDTRDKEIRKEKSVSPIKSRILNKIQLGDSGALKTPVIKAEGVKEDV